MNSKRIIKEHLEKHLKKEIMRRNILKKIIFCLVFLLIILGIYIKSFAIQKENLDSVYLQTTNTEIKNGEEFSFTINLANIDVVAFDLQIYFNNELLEYVSGPENTNVVGSKIITVWYDETGGENPKQNCELVKYTFKVKEIENEYIAIRGEFYNAEGIQVQSFTDGIEMIANKETQTEMIDISEESEVTSNNSKLKNLRFNHEGITPVFSPDITEYCFLTEDLSTLEVTAIPENTKSEVDVTGNTNFQEGLNTIQINVTSPDKTSKTQYTIWVTKTKDLEKANANLETLAIENVIIEPEFTNDIYQYDAIVSNTTENLNILAIPEKLNAKVEIAGGENLQFGNNEIHITSIAENGYTTKKYKINVYRRDEEEQRIADEEQQLNIQKLNTILEKQDEEEQSQSENHVIKNMKENIWFVIIYLIFTIIIVIFVVYKIRKNKKRKNG